uniref:Carboxylic ester hydrolase n=1 Tax=Hormiphora californensis TaxID=1403702 RepID=V9PPR7_HORCA|nr:carboxylesterase domain-containing protein [Hormiphora californensis]
MQRLLLLVVLLLHPATPAVIRTAHGRVEGSEVTTSTGTLVHEFYELPFAVPPLGDLRWTHSTLWTEEWGGVRNATTTSETKCVQGPSDNATVEVKGGEDCLRLTVRTPNTTGSLPVMVWIHGGSLRVGWAEEPGYAPDAELTADLRAVTVNINYRLDVLGFLTTHDLGDDQGNYGTGDALTALRWVRENIASFGGDPTTVTVLGESSGATVIYGLLAADEADGLFSRAILLSGPPKLVTTPKIASNLRSSFTADVGCKQKSPAKRLACLRRASTNVLASKFYSDTKGWGFYDFPYGFKGEEGESMDYAVLDSTLITTSPAGLRNKTRRSKVDLYISNTAQETGYNYMYCKTNIVYSWSDAITLLMRKMITLTHEFPSVNKTFPKSAINDIAAEYGWNKTADDWWPQLFIDSIFTDVRTTCINNDLVVNLNENEAITARRVYISQRADELHDPGTGEGLVRWSAFHGWDTEGLFGYGYYKPTTAGEVHQQRFTRNLRDFVGAVVRDEVGEGEWSVGETLHFTNDDFPGGLKLSEELPQAEKCEMWRGWGMLQFGWEN